jgi:hypothetical protein
MTKSKKEGSGISKYLTPDFVKNGIYLVIGIIIIFAIKKVIDDLFNNPFSDALKKVLGTAGTTASEILNGCRAQTRCSQKDNSEECKSFDDCTFTDSKCVTTGEPEGSGGPFSLGCLLYIGLIVNLVAYVFSFPVKFYYETFGSKTDLGKQAAVLGDKTYTEVSKDTAEKTKEDSAKVEEKFKSEKGREMTYKEKVYSAIEIANRTLVDTVNKLVNNLTDKQRQAEETAKLRENIAEIEKTKAESSEGVDTKDMDGVIDSAGIPEIPKI